MNRRIIVIRPERGSASTMQSARTLGLVQRRDVLACPLSTIEPCAWTAPDPELFDGLLIGSANALRHAGPQLALFKGMAAHTVGATSSAAARVAGLGAGVIGEGGLQEVLDALPLAPLRLLRLAGAAHVPLAVPVHVTLEVRIVYTARMLAMDDALASILREGALVLLHSAEVARHFSAEVDRLHVPRKAIALAALGPRIVGAAGAGWADCRSAARPDDAALLALAEEMCH